MDAEKSNTVESLKSAGKARVVDPIWTLADTSKQLNVVIHAVVIL
jgi:hypothetical protein